MPEVMVKRLPDNELISLPNPFFQFQFSPEQLNKISVDNAPRTTLQPHFVSSASSLKELIVTHTSFTEEHP